MEKIKGKQLEQREWPGGHLRIGGASQLQQPLQHCVVLQSSRQGSSHNGYGLLEDDDSSTLRMDVASNWRSGLPCMPGTAPW